MHGLLRCNINAGVNACTRGADVSHRDVRDRKRGERMRMTSRTGNARRIWGILKKVSGVENWTPNEKGRISGLTEAKRICALRAPHEMRVGR